MTESNAIVWKFQAYLSEVNKITTKLISNFFASQSTSNLYDDDQTKRLVAFHNTSILVGNKNKIENKILRNEPYDELQIKLCKQIIKPGFVCLDVGANIGTYTLLFSSLVGSTGKVIAFEPVEYIRKNLLINLRVNGVKNTTVYPTALGEQTCSIQMNQVKEGVYRGGTSSIVDNENFKEMGEASFVKKTVEMETLDSFCQKNSLENIDFIKVDTEGYEYSFLLGAKHILLTQKPILLMEHKQERLKFLDIDESNFKDFFETTGYSCYEVLEEKGNLFFSLFKFDSKLKNMNIICIPCR